MDTLPSFQTAIDALPRAVWLRGADLRLVWVNRAYAAALGTTPDDVITRQLELLKHSTDPDGLSLARLVAKTQQIQTALRHVVVEGARRLLLVTGQPIDGGYLGFALDQTRAEELETELTRARSAETQVLQHIATAVAIFGADQKLKFYNPSFLGISRLTPPQLDDHPTLPQVMNALREVGRLPEFPDFRRAREVWQAWFTNLITPHDEMLHLPDGTTLHLVVIPHPAGGLLFMMDDITDRLALEAAYNTQIAVQKETLDNLREGTVLLGGDGRVRLWNPAFQIIWNLPDAALQSRPHWQEVSRAMAELFHPSEWDSVHGKLVLAPLSHLEVGETCQLVDGRTVEFAAQPLPDGALLLRFLDVTDKANLTKALRDRADALVAADQLKSEFLYNVSYQLRTPLNAITGFAELMKLPGTGGLEPKQLSYVQNILEAADSLVSLIDNLLILSSIQAGQVEISRAVTNAYDLLLEVRSFAEPLAQAAELNLAVEADETLGTLLLDADRMKQVLLNLISNGIKYSPRNSVITLGGWRETRHGKPGMVLFVRDQGPGIPPDEHERVFRPFERTARKGAGAGVGLSLVKSLVQLHEGEVALISAEGQGTEVRCWIPG